MFEKRVNATYQDRGLNSDSFYFALIVFDFFNVYNDVHWSHKHSTDANPTSLFCYFCFCWTHIHSLKVLKFPDWSRKILSRESANVMFLFKSYQILPKHLNMTSNYLPMKYIATNELFIFFEIMTITESR